MKVSELQARLSAVNPDADIYLVDETPNEYGEPSWEAEIDKVRVTNIGDKQNIYLVGKVK